MVCSLLQWSIDLFEDEWPAYAVTVRSRSGRWTDRRQRQRQRHGGRASSSASQPLRSHCPSFSPLHSITSHLKMAAPSPSSSSGPSSTQPTSTTSRKGGTPHTLSEWHTSPSGSDASLPSPDRVAHRSISISSWTITTSRGAIGNSAYMDELGDGLGVPPPEMVFPSNTLVIKHEKSGWSYRFGAEEALRCVEGVAKARRLDGVDLSEGWRVEASSSKAGGGHHKTLGAKPQAKRGIKVAYAQEWGKSRNDPANHPAMAATTTSSETTEPPTTAFGAAAATQIADARDYDWTFSTTWAGSSSSSSSSSSFQPATDPTTDRIPVERLGPSSGEPILFYDDLVLFEDELGDNGTSLLGVKVRVMPSGFLILQRFFLRVDDVVFRLFDTRMYCAFNEPGTGVAGMAIGGATAMPQVTRPGAAGAAVPPPAAAPWATARPAAPASATAAPDLSSLRLGQPRTAAAATANEAASSSSSTSHPPQRLIRELSGCEAPYKDVRARLPPYRPNDLSLLTDPGWVAQTLETITARQFAGRAAAAGAGGAQHPALAATKVAQSVQPAMAPGAAADGGAGAGGAAVLGEVGGDGEDDVWEGVGQRVDVVIFDP